MISDEVGLSWSCVRIEHGPRGEELRESRCQHPRLVKLVQRPSQDADWVETYHVEGLAQVYHTPSQALQALEHNP